MRGNEWGVRWDITKRTPERETTHDEVDGLWTEPRSGEEAEKLLVACYLSQVSRKVVAVLREVSRISRQMLKHQERCVSITVRVENRRHVAPLAADVVGEIRVSRVRDADGQPRAEGPRDVGVRRLRPLRRRTRDLPDGPG